MVLRIRVRLGKHDIAGAGECVQSPTTKRQRVRREPKKDSALQITKTERRKKMQKQPLIPAAGEIIRKPIKLRILINSEQRRGFVEVKKPNPPPVVQQPACWPFWALSPGQASDSVSSCYDGGGGESVSVNQPWRPTYFSYPEVNSYSGFRGGGRVRPGCSENNPVVISGDDSDKDDAESVGENDPVYDRSDDGEVESCPGERPRRIRVLRKYDRVN
ncbi:unnamed protein product [Linum trigynum]|uniref:Uncharacterized protein n=1 Tax=Linum trigynum TaxID=586398 RepID=A0AAV2EXX7_9ROSI